MSISISTTDWIKRELGGLYGATIVQDINAINRLYSIYDGPGQNWSTASGLGYTPTQTITNYIKKLIKAEARFMFSRMPEIKFVAEEGTDNDACKKLEQWMLGVLNATRFRKKLIQAGRDCFIGKRVAMKISGGQFKALRVDFCPAQEFVYETMEDDTTQIKKICFFYQVAGENDENDKTKQRIWRQRYEMRDGLCFMDEGLFDGNGAVVLETFKDYNTQLPFIPCHVIVNDGLTGDTRGESDVEMLLGNQDVYNRMNSDDCDALRFSMFPMRYTVDASEDSASKIVIAPNAYADLTSEGSGNDSQAKIGMLESTFSYDARIENRLKRTKNDMHELLSVPNVGLEQLKGLGQSGKAMKSLYWDLICRCDEKWAEGWDDAMRWMAETLIEMARRTGQEKLPTCEYNIVIDHCYPIPDDEEEERANDQSEVQAQVRSRKSYIGKWQREVDPDGELKQIAAERKMLDDDYAGAILNE